MPEIWFWFFVAFVGGGLLFDWWAFKTKKVKTASTWFAERTKSWPMFVLLVGILFGAFAGHLWWCYCGT